MRRHGPMVLGVARRHLRNETDAEDVFQATFLVLVRKAASVRPRTMVGNWLFGVARTTALKAKAAIVRRMLKAARSIPNEWGHHVKFANTPAGLGIHAINLDADIGPWLQVLKLKGLKDDAEKALAFLKKQKAVFSNYLIDETTEAWSKKLDVGGPPAVLVYDRSGKKIKTFTSEDPFDYAYVEKMIVPLLKEKQ